MLFVVKNYGKISNFIVKVNSVQSLVFIQQMSTASGTPQKNNAFMQVESELEKMFAGIVETPGDSDKPETPESSKSSKKSMAVKRKARRPRTKKELDSGKKRRAKSPNAEALRLKKRFGPRADKIKEGSNDSSSISTGQVR